VSHLRVALRLPLLVGLLFGGLATVLLLFPLGGARFRRAAIRIWSGWLVAACGIRVESRVHPAATALSQCPPGTFFVANHLSWLDIFVIDAQCPASFVAKAEIADWPLVGTLVARTGNLFIERGKRHAVHRMIERIVQGLGEGARVAVFPEGTTSDGRRLLPFHANLIEAAVRARAPVVPLAIGYRGADGQPSRAIEFIGDTTFVQSLIAVLREPGIRCELNVLAPIVDPGARRHDIAARARETIASCLRLPLDDTLPENLRELRGG